MSLKSGLNVVQVEKWIEVLPKRNQRELTLLQILYHQCMKIFLLAQHSNERRNSGNLKIRSLLSTNDTVYTHNIELRLKDKKELREIIFVLQLMKINK